MAQETGTTNVAFASRPRPRRLNDLGDHVIKTRPFADKPVLPIPTRVQALQAQARALAAAHVQDVVAEMKALEASAASIADGGEAYPAGIRDLCRRMAADLEGTAQTITALAGRRP